MIASSRRWLRRNRARIGVGLGVLGAGYLAGQYVLGKIAETRERMTGERIAKENLRRRFKQNQEDCTFTVLALLPTATENILEALPAERISAELQARKDERLGRSTATSEASPSDLGSSTSPPPKNGDEGSVAGSVSDSTFFHTSQMESSMLGAAGGTASSRKSKAQLWSELKIMSITRAFTLIYTLALLTLLTRIQLNLLGRRNYLSSVVSLATAPTGPDAAINLEDHDEKNQWGTDFDTNRRYLTFSWWLLHRGWRDIMTQVEEAVRAVFGPLNPREDVSLERLSQLIIEVRKRVEGETEEARRTHKWLPYLLPPRDQEDFVLHESGILVDPNASDQPSPSSGSLPAPPTLFSQLPSLSPDPLRRLLDETADLIDSPTATHILTLLSDALFSQLTDVALRQHAFKLPDPAVAPIVEELSSDSNPAAAATTKLHTLMAAFTHQAHAIGNGVPNDYVQAMEDVRELEAFAAVVYSSNFELDGAVREAGEGAEAADGPAPTQSVPQGGPAPAATGIVGATWGVFEGVWSRVTGQ